MGERPLRLPAAARIGAAAGGTGEGARFPASTIFRSLTRAENRAVRSKADCPIFVMSPAVLPEFPKQKDIKK